MLPFHPDTAAPSTPSGILPPIKVLGAQKDATLGFLCRFWFL
ncbi:hypothetical protein F383_33351 [Gossypium arboreum]|uniref:Uncharacterized protein n=1 Tax=Gossypium arboreum TaxID=29729 RepID=A0A0B0PN58_GOSAR|nr:hypothetical protein F383_33351 [Gossypium arboreum]